jgi:hypothetical protein
MAILASAVFKANGVIDYVADHGEIVGAAPDSFAG